MKLLNTIILIFCLSVAFGQNEYYVPSPQTSDFIKYGNLPVAHYTGNLNLQIPIYNYSDNDFNIDVSVGYNSSGFVANKQPGIVGMNWFLNTGGVITRNTKGVPDDKIGNPTSAIDPPFVHGLWYGLKRDLNNYSSLDIYNFNEGQATTHLDWALGSSTQNNYETTSDIYNFNFMGYRGKFIIGQDKQAHVFGIEGSNTFDIDLTGFSDQYDNTNYPDNSTIIIKTGDGYKYTFGGSIEKLEYSMQVDIDLEPASDFDFNPTIVSWHLKEIEAPNGRKVILEYRPFTPIPIMEDTFNYILSRYPKSYSSTYETYTSYSWLVSHFYSSGYISEDPTYELLKTAYLNKILIDDDCEINFYYSEKEKRFYQTVTTNYSKIYEQKNLKLDSVVVKSFDNSIKKAVFSYSYKGNLNKDRLFLDEVEIQGQTPYTFDYISGNFPSPTTRGMDYWGFWNGVDDENADLIPTLDLDVLGNLDYTSNVREPNANNGIFNLGLLNRVTYPTGGYTAIEYEPHRYTQKLDRRSDNNFLPKLYSNTESYAGGARVKKITDYDGANQYNEREFIYKKAYNTNISGSGTSSGILLNWPRFIYAFSSSFLLDHNETNVVQVNSLGISINATDNEYISYSHVVEKRSDNSYTEFQYSNYTTNPDDTAHISVNTWIADAGYTTEPYSFYVNIYRHPNCKPFERGKLRRKSHFSSSGDLASEESFSYDRWGDENYVASDLLSGDKFYSRKDYTYPYVLKYDTIKNYSLNANGTYGSSFVQTVTEFDYNSLNLLSLKNTQNSNNHWSSEEYYYPNDYSSVENFQTLITNNIVNKLIDTRAYNNNQLISGTQTKYNNLGQPTDIYIAEIDEGVTDISFDANKPYKFTHRTNYLYNGINSLKQVVPDDDINTAFLWDATGIYLMAKVENATHSQISSQDGKDCTYNSLTLFNSLKNLALNSLITTYSYDPLIGLTSQTGPDGRTTYYEYDNFGRLEYVRDHNGNIIKKHEYHYANQ